MKYLTLLTFCVALLFSTLINAQSVEPAENVDNNIFQFEIETSYTKQEKGIEKMESFTIPNLMLRYGLTNAIELQASVPLVKEKLHSNNTLVHTNHLVDDIQLGIQYELFKEKKLLPQTAFMVRTVIPSSNASFERLSYITALNFTNNITEKLSLNYNLGTLFNRNETTLGYYIFNVSYAPNKFHYFIENSAEVAYNHKAFQNICVGFGIDISSNFTIDFSTTNGLNHNLFAAGAIFIYNFKI
ncbi:MAG TPA: transporter [Flavobacteriaceae bacterium]|nr:transporter [Flavobacteriaceae bacterium]